MKTEKNDSKSDKLRQRLTSMFKKGNVKVGTQVNGKAHKEELKKEPLPTKVGMPKSKVSAQANGNASKSDLNKEPLPTKVGKLRNKVSAQVNGKAYKEALKKEKLPTKLGNTKSKTNSNASKVELKKNGQPTEVGKAQRKTSTQVNGNARKEQSKKEPLPTNVGQAKSNIKAPLQDLPKNNNRKRKLQQNTAPKQEKKSATVPKKQNKNAKTVGGGNHQEGKVDSKTNSTTNGKGKKSNNKNKKAKVVKEEQKINLPLVQHNGSNNAEMSGSEDSEDYFDSEEDYDSDDAYSFDDDYFHYDQYDNDDYSDSDSNDEEYFKDYEYGYEDSDCDSDSDSKYTENTESENEYHYDSDPFSGADPDYELPRNVAEDLVIHRGTAQKHDLSEEHNVEFDSDNDEPQVVELVVESKISEIKQPDAYAKTELHRLNVEFIKPNKTPVVTNELKEKVENENDCPQLVPIVDEDGFQLYNPDSDSSDYSSYEEEEVSDESSIPEEDINLKYTCSGNVCDSDCDSDDSLPAKKRKPIFNLGIVNVENCIPQENSESVIRNDEAEIDKPILNMLHTANTKCDKNTIITVNICERTTTSEPLEETVEKKSDNKATQASAEYEKQNVNANSLNQPINQETELVAVNETVNDDVVMVTPSLNEEIVVAAEKEIEDLNEEMDVSADFDDEIAKSFNINEIINHNQETATFRSIFTNAVNSNLVLVLVKEPFYLYGTVTATLLAGKVEIYGYTPRLNEELEIFSPRGCCSVDITSIPSNASDNDKAYENSMDSLQSAFSSVDLERIEKAFESGRDALLLLQRNNRRKKLKNIFKKYMNENVFPNMNSIQTDRPLYASEYLLDCVLNIDTERSLRIPKEWRDLYFTNNSKVLLAGGKSVGKSTLLRYLLNRHLEHSERVLVIDLDIGQAELFTPQTVSCTVLTQPLLGPGFFLNHQPTRAYAVGHCNIILCAQAYMRAVKKLIDYCNSNKEFAEMPWLINTMGYNKGFGLEVMHVITQLIRPTDVVQLQSNREINNFDILLHSHALARLERTIYTQDEFKAQKSDSATVEYRLHILSSAILQESRYQRDWEMSAKDLRYATLLSRLSDVLQGSAEWLTDCMPFGVFIDKLQLVNLVSNKSSREELIHAFEANLVYLCRKEVENENNEPIECFGIGIVRAIDHKKLYLLPAMSYDKLSVVNCLALGEMPLPASLFTNQGPRVCHMAAYLYNTVDAKTSKSIKQIYHRPTQFLTGKHKNVLGE
ncbi:polynucleotide 5'-hydroxyl-kinase NOL9 [Zeugodacus cucurbitae]|uniref:polynucleotide 5'-hydroxyl-kinase NOL9 n=1 Tax=Zeugodacus cucurbitae TaxID=28588 RepID=UPI0023D956E1|nr:polynucleotide 5'-hydroxyl-kinase NOL9 [Zeugodacus cucurbitae]